MDWKIYFIQGIELLFLGIGAWLDMKDQRLPVIFLLIFGVIGILCNLFLDYQSLNGMAAGCLIGGAFLVIGWLTKEALGYADGIALLILGIFEGAFGILPVLMTAFFLSGIYGSWCLLGKKYSGSDSFPFFPFLLLAFTGVKLL